MLRVLSVLCLVVAAHAWGGDEDMMKKYAYSKIMSNCFGEEFVMNWKMQMKAACDVCEGKDVMQTVVDLQKMVKELQKKYSPFRAAASQQPMYVPVPYYQAQPYFVPQSFRTKRSMHDLSPEGMQMMKEKLMMKMSNVTCVMKEMKYGASTPATIHINNKIDNIGRNNVCVATDAMVSICWYGPVSGMLVLLVSLNVDYDV
ncbi:hypothetical protein SK128_023819, partial [Halocaridina rubra]